MEQYLKGGGREQCDQVCQKFAIFDKVLKVFDNYFMAFLSICLNLERTLAIVLSFGQIFIDVNGQTSKTSSNHLVTLVEGSNHNTLCSNF